MPGDRRPRPHLADRADIIGWAERMEARSEFPRLIRGLIQRNNDQLLELEMRAAEGTGAPGYDGITRAARGTPFVPEGVAVWELGTSADFKRKANQDYNARSADPLGRLPHETTFVFVTPRQWTDKQVWMNDRKSDGVWADVRVLDVDDIEQALELAPAIHARFSETVGKPGYGAQSVEDWWSSFSALTSPPLDPALVLSGRADEAASLIRLFQAESRLTTVAAPTIDDVLAFVAAATMSSPEAEREEILGRALIVRDAFALRELSWAEGLLILLPYEDDLRREARLIRSHHVVIRADEGQPADVSLPPIDRDQFEQLLRERGEPEVRAAELARAARRSVVAFQRRGAEPGAALSPPWAERLASPVTRRGWLAGKWNERRSGDAEALAVLFGVTYEQAREELLALAEGGDPLFVRVGDAWAVASVDDAWQYGHSRLQPSDLAAFEVLVQSVLGAVDPKLDLPISDRWAAAIYGKTRFHSSDLRSGIAEVLALLGARGESVSIGAATLQSWLRGVLWQLFKRANEDLSGHLWASLTDEMPLLAEAVPDVFLEAIQQGLEGERPLLGAMFADHEGDALTVSSPHTGLLWALEGLAWAPEFFSLAVEQLARLAELDPGGRLSNRPAASLASIFRPWMPQTSVEGERRLGVLDGLRKRHPTVSWSLMLSMLPEHHAVGHYNHAPRFRTWRPVETRRIPADRDNVEAEVASRLLDDSGENPDRWVDLIRRVDDFPRDLLGRLVERVDHLTSTPSGAEVRSRVWEPLHTLVVKHQRFSYTDWAMAEDDVTVLDALQRRLAPEDAVDRHRWLFDQPLPDLPELNEPEFHYEASTRAASRRRADALGEMWAGASQAEDLLRLVRSAKSPALVGIAVHDAALDDAGILLLDQIDSDEWNVSVAASAWARERISAAGWAWTEQQATALAARPVAVARVLLECDELERAWTVAETDRRVDDAYWAEFSPYGRGQGFSLAGEAAARLFAHDRPKAALTLMNLYLGSVTIDPLLVVEALERLLEVPADHPDKFRVDGHEIERLLDFVRRADIDEERLAVLEWRLRPALRFDAHSPVLERKLAREPGFFVEVMSLVYKPHNTEPEREVPANAAANAYRLLDDWDVVPGSEQPGSSVDEDRLNAWVDEALALLEAADRYDIGLDQIGKIMAKAGGDGDGTWPTRPVRDVIERIGRSELDDGFRVQVYNSRGPTSRGLTDGGDQERALSVRYSDLASAIRDGWPRVARILDSLADGYADAARQQDERVERFREGLGR